MYDGVGRPFMFARRTNGALVWDHVRALHDVDKNDHAAAEAALQRVSPGQSLVFWQPREESFPRSGSFALTRLGNIEPTLENDYSGVVESSLAAVFQHSKGFTAPVASPLYVMGGPTGSPQIVRRVAAIWNRPVVVTGKAGAALGAAVAGVSALMNSEGMRLNVAEFSEPLVSRGRSVEPDPSDVGVFHNPGGYLERFAVEEASLVRRSPQV